MCGGGWVLATVKAPLPVILHIGAQGTAAFIVPAITFLTGFLLWFNPQQRLFYAIMGLASALASWVTSNLGGFFIGMVLGMVGGSLALAWVPDKKKYPRQKKRVIGPPAALPDDAGMDLVATDQERQHWAPPPRPAQDEPQQEETPGRPVR
jgi:uncharacterized protein DUF6114